MAFLQHQAKAVWENKEYKGEKDYHVTNNELESGTGDVEKIFQNMFVMICYCNQLGHLRWERVATYQDITTKFTLEKQDV